MDIKTPSGVTVAVDVEKCSRHLPNDQGVIETGYRAGDHEVRVTVTDALTDNPKMTAVAVPLSAAARHADEKNKLADDAVKAKAAEIKAAGDAAAKAVSDLGLPEATVANVRYSAEKQAQLKIGAAAVAEFNKAHEEAAKKELKEGGSKVAGEIFERLK